MNVTQLEHPEQAGETSSFWKLLTRTTEGHILISGFALAAVYGIGLLIALWADGTLAKTLGTMTVVYFVFGSAVGIATAYAGELRIGAVLGLAIFISSTQVLIFYPLFVFASLKLLAIGPFYKRFEAVRSTARAHRDTVEKYGAVGLAAFVALPIAFTGPLIGSALGFLLGMKPWRVLVSVLSGATVTLLGWALLLRAATRQVQAMGPWFTWAGLVIVVLVLIAMKVASKLRKKKWQGRSPPASAARSARPARRGPRSGRGR